MPRSAGCLAAIDATEPVREDLCLKRLPAEEHPVVVINITAAIMPPTFNTGGKGNE
jgi:hypothetical protein